MYFFTRLHAANGGASRLTAALAAALNLWSKELRKRMHAGEKEARMQMRTLMNRVQS